MSIVSDLNINEPRTEVSWIYSGNSVHFRAGNIGQAIEGSTHGKVVVSLCKGEYPYQIKVLEVTGEELFSFDDPKPFEFYYLKKHSTYGVSIICTINEPVDGRMDWQFEIDYKKGALKRASPSY